MIGGGVWVNSAVEGSTGTYGSGRDRGGAEKRARESDGTVAPASIAPMLALLLASLSFQAAPAPGTYPGKTILDALQAGHYLAALVEAEKTRDSAELRDLYGLVQSYVGEEQEMLVTFDALGGEREAELAHSPLEDAEALDAIPAIVAASKGRQIVILNESHHMARNRAFALELARALRAEGFDTFAAETFGDVAPTTARGYPTHATGFYTAEPVFGELVRGVLALGYTLVQYEAQARPPDGDVNARINQREIEQAQNLFERVFQKNPRARLLAYVGYSHATEDWQNPGRDGELAWMAARLAKLTGLDPLTIDQTVGLAHSEPAFENAHWRRAEERGLLTGPRVFRLADGSFFTGGIYAKRVDMQVFHPRSSETYGRPDWLAAGRIAVPLPKELAAELAKGERLLVQAFHAGEGEGAIPADQFVVQGDPILPRLFLRKGEYRLVLQDAQGRERLDLAGVRVE